jgi:hypothetical protein
MIASRSRRRRARLRRRQAKAAPKRLGATAVSQEDIRRDMSAIAGKAVLFLDTCHANPAVAAHGPQPGRRGCGEPR